MPIGKNIMGFGSALLYYIILVIYFFSAISSAQGNGITSWSENSIGISFLIGSFIILMLINMIRLKFGLSMVMMKKEIKHQAIIFVFVSMMLSSIGLLAIHSYTLVATLFIVGFVGASIVKYRIWSVFTEIRESDHDVFRKRLKISGAIIIGFGILSFFDSSGNSFMSTMLLALYYGLLASSFYIGFIVVRKQIATVLNTVDTFQAIEERKGANSLRREKENYEINSTMGYHTPPSVMPHSNLWLANIAMIVAFIVSLISAILIGLVMIPFYVYVLATNKVTVTHPM